METSDIKPLREAKGWSKRKLAIMAGISPAYIGLLENGQRRDPSAKKMRRIEEALGVGKQIQIQETNNDIRPLQNSYIFVNIIGIVPAGIPSLVDQQNLGRIPVHISELGGMNMDSVFALRIKGNSLSGDEIEDGSTVIVEKTSAIIDGRIYIVRIGNETVARHLFRKNGLVVLTASNGFYQEIKLNEVEILGMVFYSYGPGKKH